MDTLGQRIKRLRIDKGMSQVELGELVNVGNSTVSQWESDKRVPDIATVNQLAKVFDVSVDYLLGNGKPRELPQTVAPYLPEGYDELSPEAKEEVLNFIDYIMVKYGKKEDKGNK